MIPGQGTKIPRDAGQEKKLLVLSQDILQPKEGREIRGKRK